MSSLCSHELPKPIGIESPEIKGQRHEAHGKPWEASPGELPRWRQSSLLGKVPWLKGSVTDWHCLNDLSESLYGHGTRYPCPGKDPRLKYSHFNKRMAVSSIHRTSPPGFFHTPDTGQHCPSPLVCHSFLSVTTHLCTSSYAGASGSSGGMASYPSGLLLVN